MNILEKSYWKTKNFLEAEYAKLIAPGQFSGCLPSRKDSRDFIFGGVPTLTKPQYNWYGVANDLWRYSQNPFNTCVFASAVIGASHQEGKRFSVRFTVMMAKRLGMITSNGFSYLRAAREISVKYGRLPYEFMPDEIAGMSWEKYSRYEVTDEMIKEAAKWKAPSYEKINNLSHAIQAIEAGLVLYSANEWFSAMNSPIPDDYYLERRGRKVGAHAWFIGWYRGFEGRLIDWETVQSFGMYYGNDGKARLKKLFDTGQFEIYVEQKIQGRSDLERMVGVYEGLCIKDPDHAPIYLVENGTKRHIQSMEAYHRLNKKQWYAVHQNFIDVIPEGEPIV